MKRITLYIAVAALLAAGACKTNEANYRAAYEAAKEKIDTDNADIDVALMDKERPRPMVFGADTLPTRSFFIGYTTDGGADKDRSLVKGYCVVVGKFKQVFNARSMRQRLIANGYPSALVIHDTLKDYYVIATTTNDTRQAAIDLAKVRADSSLVLKSPFPYVLLPGHLHRHR